MPILSVIVPVYNVEKYLNECLESIINQTFTDMEIICINDGSTDCSLEILKKWATIDKRILVISQENKGLSATRNKGLKIASGKYIAFVDSDDKLSPEIYTQLFNYIKEKKLDAIGCSFQTFPNGHNKHFSFTTDTILTFQSLISSNQQLQTSNDLCFCWRYIIKKEILFSNHIYFNESVRFGEDMIFITEALQACKSIYLTNDALYYYRIDNNNSIMKVSSYNPYIEKSLDILYHIKKEQAQKYQIDLHSPFTKDLAEYTIKSYIPILFKNAFLKENGNAMHKHIKHVLNMPMITDAMKVIGFQNIYPSWKEYIFYLAMKFKCTRLVHKLYFK